MNKICCNCKEEKSIEDFGKKAKSVDGLQPRCTLCKRSYDNTFHKNRGNSYKTKKYQSQRKRIDEIRSFMYSYLLDKSCSACGESRMPALDFHHLRDKKFNISEGVASGYSLSKLKEEIEKCEILCANCHRVETAKNFNWYSQIK